MWDDHEILKLRVLLVFLKGDADEHSVVKISKTLNVTKQRVSRLLMELEKDEIIDRSNPRNPRLTDKGRKKAEYYAERVTVSMNHLLFEGVSIENAEQDAYHWAIYNTDETMDVIKSASSRYQVKYQLRNRHSFNGNVLCKTLGDGVYRFNFVIYREQVKDGSNLSMANDGFVHPGTLFVKNGVGTIHLHIVRLKMQLPYGIEAEGKISGVKYLENGEFIPAEVSEDTVNFPASVLTFVNIGENINQMLHGSVCLKIRCAVTTAHAAESMVVFNVLL